MGLLWLVFAGGIYLAYTLSDNPGESAKNADSLNFSLTEETKTRVETYIQDHVSEFSPEKEVLGGKFYITKITFLSSARAEVEYEDGHNAFTANVDFYADFNNTVQILNWQIVKKN